MAISESKSRVAMTFPSVDLEVFRKDAADLNLSLSQYVYMVLAANSWNMDAVKGDSVCSRIEKMKEEAWGKLR